MQLRASHSAGVPTPGDYLLGHDRKEQLRLAEQGVILRPMTERLLRDAGVRPGMRVLDVGCGVGDVTCLVAEIVGPAGAAVGVDFAGSVLATARSRAASRGLGWARFVEGNVASVPLARLATERFDAVVGRLVLMYQPDPTTVLRHLATMVKAGGVLVFQEGVAFTPRAWPYRPLYAECVRRVLTTFERSGATMDMGLRLHQVFLDAGLPAPEVHLDGIMVAGADARGFRWLADIVRSALPGMERHGVATADEVQIETLVDRLVQEAREAPGAVCGLGLGGAWARIPTRERSPLELLAVSDGR